MWDLRWRTWLGGLAVTGGLGVGGAAMAGEPVPPPPPPAADEVDEPALPDEGELDEPAIPDEGELDEALDFKVSGRPLDAGELGLLERMLGREETLVDVLVHHRSDPLAAARALDEARRGQVLPDESEALLALAGRVTEDDAAALSVPDPMLERLGRMCDQWSGLASTFERMLETPAFTDAVLLWLGIDLPSDAGLIDGEAPPEVEEPPTPEP